MALPLASRAVSVYVRVRPLTAAEREKNATDLPGLSLISNDVTETEATAFDDTSDGGFAAIGGFNGVLGCSASNRDVFERCFGSQLETVFRGGTASLFCYGYTGSGKTHTVIGYGDERGLYFLAAQELLQTVKATASELFLKASVCELYNDEVFDLLSDRTSCDLRVNEEGQLQVIGKQTSAPLPSSETSAAILEELVKSNWRSGIGEATLNQDWFATMLTRASGLQTLCVHQAEDLQEISTTCVQQRAAGSSSEHAQSSRSHCILQMEIVSQQMLEAQEKVDEAKALIGPRKNALDNVMLCRFKLLWASIGHGLFPGHAPIDKSDYHPSYPESGFYDLKDGYEVDISKGAVNGLIHVRGQDGAKSLEDWAKHFGVGELAFGMTRARVHYEKPGRWEALKEILDKESAVMREHLEHAERTLQQSIATLEDVKARGPKAVGGRLVLVDLAGADYDHRSGSEQKESAAINKSLLALKECFRSIAKVASSKPKFRDSKLTRLLEDSLAPSACSMRRNSESVSVMLVNVSPAKHLGSMTFNTLRYGQMFATAEKPKHSVAKQYSQKSRKPVAHSCDPKTKKAIFSIYRQHCPEKGDHEIETIIGRFSGREAELLDKAREKYGSVQEDMITQS